MELNLHPAVRIWLNSFPKGQQGAAISNALLAVNKIPEMEAKILRMEREIERLKIKAEETD